MWYDRGSPKRRQLNDQERPCLYLLVVQASGVRQNTEIGKWMLWHSNGVRHCLWAIVFTPVMRLLNALPFRTGLTNVRLQRKGSLLLWFLYMSVSGMLRPGSDMNWLTQATWKYCVLKQWGRSKLKSQWGLERLSVLSEVMLRRGRGEHAVGQRWVTVQECWGVTLNLGQKSRNIGTRLSAFYQVHQVLDGHPLARDTLWTACSAALGRLSAGFSPAEQSPLVHWSSHRLLARPAQNPVSSDFLCSCIIFPCLLNG